MTEGSRSTEILLNVLVGLGKASQRRKHLRRALIQRWRGNAIHKRRNMLTGHVEGTASGRDISSLRCELGPGGR